MKKLVTFTIALVTLTAVIVLGFNYKKSAEPHQYYQVYMEDKLLGTIKSKDALEKYIDDNGKYYKNKYKTKRVYEPTGLQIKKIVTYSNKTDNVKKIYNQISKNSSFTVKGYQVTVNKEKDKKITKTKIYVLDKDLFKKSVLAIIKTFVNEDEYQAYLDGTQEKIETTGKVIQNVYIDENITIKEKKIPVDETIYTDENELSKYLLYGKDAKISEYYINAGDTIETVALNNKVSPSELLLSNDDLKSTNNLLYPGQKLIIEQTNPLLSVVEENYSVTDTPSNYKTEERYDSSAIVGDDKVVQEGQKGLDRVSQETKIVNGEIVYVNPKGKEVLKDPVNRVILKGNKYVPEVGSLTSWGWPTDSGWTMSSGYGYRAMWGSREMHTGLDISGTGYGSKIYATNNGRVMIAEYHYSYGNYVVINHNNGYMTVYAHMSKMAVKAGQLVERGQVIGYVGCTGSCTGPHVHYEIWQGSKYHHVNPSILYPNGYR